MSCAIIIAIMEPTSSRKRISATDRRRRTLSQNFLIDPSAIQSLVDFARLAPSDTVVEVGAGAGVLTAVLAARSQHVYAYEVDDNLKARLDAQLSEITNVDVFFEDVMRARKLPPSFKVVGNVPFGKTAEIVRWFLSAPSAESAAFITQLEYARKRTGASGRWSRLTVSTWPRFEWILGPKIRRSAFRPIPSVDASIIGIHRRSVPLVSDTAAMRRYERMVDVGFRGIGGTLYRSLRQEYPTRPLQRAFQAAGVKQDEVVAFVHPEKWLDVFNNLETYRD